MTATDCTGPDTRTGAACAARGGVVRMDMTIPTRIVAASLVLMVAGTSLVHAEVRIERVTVAVETGEGGLLDTNVLATLVRMIIETLDGRR